MDNVTALDNCDGQVEVTFDESQTPGECEGFTIIRKWTAIDKCGNVAEATQTIIVADVRPPSITNLPADITLECDEVYPPAEPTVSDNCDEEVELTWAEVITPGNCLDAYSLVRTWTATDDCGNTLTRSQRITVVDSKAPTFEGVPNDVTVDLTIGEVLPEVAQVSATDNCALNVIPEFTEVEMPSDDGGCNRIVTRTWTDRR